MSFVVWTFAQANMSLKIAPPKDLDNRKKGLCQECQEKAILYQCPRCSVRTCSLACCQAHKASTGCNGKRDKTAFLPVSRMTDATMTSDFHFLSEGLAQVDAGQRLIGTLDDRKRPRQHDSDDTVQKLHPLLQLTAQSSNKLEFIRPLFQQQPARRNNNNNFQQRAAVEAGVKVLVLPAVMERHQMNQSCFTRDGVLQWSVEWCWHVETTNNETTQQPTTPTLRRHTMTTTTTTVHNTAETSVVWEVLQKQALHQDLFSLQSNSIDHCNCSILLQRLPCPANQPVYVEISRTATIAEALRDITVVEFPTFHIVLNTARSRHDFPRVIEEVAC